MATDRQKLVNSAHRLLQSRADAEDAVQDTYVRAYDTYSDWQAAEPAWMYAVMRNIAIDRLRRLRTESTHADAGRPSEMSVPLDIGSECEAAIRHLLRRVSPMDAAALLLREVFELDHQEIAALIGKSEAATRQMLHRARVRVRARQAHGEADDCYVYLCCRAVETREPALLMELLQGTIAQAHISPDVVNAANRARSGSTLVQVNGRYAVALVLDGVVLCVVPVGVDMLRSESTV